MCTELILAFIYFNIILLANYFIFTLFKNNLLDIFFLIKIGKIFQFFSNNKILLLFLIFKQKNKKNLKMIFFWNKKINIEDLIIISALYEFLYKNILSGFQIKNLKKFSWKEKKNFFFINKIYFQLLNNQYFFFK
jgi:hypothetical protein